MQMPRRGQYCVDEVLSALCMQVLSVAVAFALSSVQARALEGDTDEEDEVSICHRSPHAGFPHLLPHLTCEHAPPARFCGIVLPEPHRSHGSKVM